MKGTWLRKPSGSRVAVVFIHGILSSSHSQVTAKGVEALFADRDGNQQTTPLTAWLRSSGRVLLSKLDINGPCLA